MHRVEVSLLGFTIEVDAPPDAADELLNALARRIVADAGHGVASLLYELRAHGAGYEVVRLDATSCERIDIAGSIDGAAALIADNLHPWVAEQHSDLLIVHAGVVEWRNTAIVVPGRSHAGKSSLIAALLQRGARYLSDEFALIDRAGDVHPYPRALSIRAADGATVSVPPTQFGASTAPASVPVGIIVDTSYVAGANFEPYRMQGASGLLSIIDNALVARSRPAFTMEIVAGLSPQVVVLRSPRGEADQAAEVILEEVEAGEGAAVT